MTLPCLVSALHTQIESANHSNYPDFTGNHDGRSAKVLYLHAPLQVLIVADTEAALGFYLKALLGKKEYPHSINHHVFVGIYLLCFQFIKMKKIICFDSRL